MHLRVCAQLYQGMNPGPFSNAGEESTQSPTMLQYVLLRVQFFMTFCTTKESKLSPLPFLAKADEPWRKPPGAGGAVPQFLRHQVLQSVPVQPTCWREEPTMSVRCDKVRRASSRKLVAKIQTILA